MNRELETKTTTSVRTANKEFTIFTDTIMLLVYPPPPKKKKKKKILHNHYLRFLLGRLYYSGEIGNNGLGFFGCIMVYVKMVIRFRLAKQ